MEIKDINDLNLLTREEVFQKKLIKNAQSILKQIEDRKFKLYEEGKLGDERNK